MGTAPDNPEVEADAEAGEPVEDGVAAEAPAEPAPAKRRGRVRLTSVAGTVAALLLGLCFFLDWVRVEDDLATHFREGLDEALDGKSQKTQVDEDFQALAGILETEGALTGMDLIYWVRTACSFGRQLESEFESEQDLSADARTRRALVLAADAPTQRALVLARLLLYAMLFIGFLLAAYFLFHGFRRVTTPVLILCVLVGASAVVLAGGLNYGYHLVQDALGEDAAGVRPGPGPVLLLVGGAGLVLAGTFGVSLRNFHRVYVGVGVTAGALYLLAARYMQAGSIP